MRKVRNIFSHDYPDDPQLQAEMLNKAFELTEPLPDVLDSIKDFIRPYLN